MIEQVVCTALRKLWLEDIQVLRQEFAWEWESVPKNRVEAFPPNSFVFKDQQSNIF